MQASFFIVGICSSAFIPAGFARNALIPQSDTGKHGQHTAKDTVTGSDSGIGCDQDRQESKSNYIKTLIQADIQKSEK